MWVFPTPVGMNLRDALYPNIGVRVPHTRGDEPPAGLPRPPGRPVFPTPVGMNRYRPHRRFFSVCVPHTRGDEPKVSSTSSGT